MAVAECVVYALIHGAQDLHRTRSVPPFSWPALPLSIRHPEDVLHHAVLHGRAQELSMPKGQEGEVHVLAGHGLVGSHTSRFSGLRPTLLRGTVR